MEEVKLPDAATGLPKADATATVVEKVVETPDYLKMLQDKDEQIKKLADDRDNYRKGMLKYKKEGAPKDDNPQPLEEDRIKQIVQETLLNTDLAKAQAEKDALIKKMAIENSELKTAIANKAQISNMPGGSGQPENDIKLESLTPEMKADLIERAKQAGADPEKFIKSFMDNLKKPK